MGAKGAGRSMNTKGALRKNWSTLHPNTILKPSLDSNAHPQPYIPFFFAASLKCSHDIHPLAMPSCTGNMYSIQPSKEFSLNTILQCTADGLSKSFSEGIP